MFIFVSKKSSLKYVMLLSGAKFDWDAEKEAKRLLRMARRTKRKFGNPIIIN